MGVWVDGVDYLTVSDSTIASGKPGVGVSTTPYGNSIARVDLGPLDRTAPSSVNTASIAISALPNRVDLQWDPPSDGANGVGAAYYYVLRNGSQIASISGAEFSDATVSSGTTYTYTLQAMDYHFNVDPTGASFSVTTPPAGSIDPRQVGLRPTGAYWGAGGEQIDTRSGNLNFTLPLLKAMGRNGWGVPFALSYNSQIWRQEGGRDWKLGHDVGYGVGWRLQAGSITPYWSAGTIHHYTVMDSTGAEYRLDVNTSGLWTSQEAVYFRYEPLTYRLYFPDGSFWVMGAVSAGTEQDSGTRYPTIMEDSNGNQVMVRYQQGAGVPWSDSSARITEIVDVRARQQPEELETTTPWLTYSLAYTSGPFPHLTDVSSNIGTAENYHFTYASQNLYSPFATSFFGGTSLLAQVTVTGLGIGHTMEYCPVSDGTSGELTRVTMPHRGWIRWDYRPFTYPGSRNLREIQYRYLGKSYGGPETTYTFAHDDSPSSQLHAWTTLADPTGPAKYWRFVTDTAQWTVGLLSGFEGRTSPSTGAIRTQAYTWAQDSMYRPYLAQVLTTIDPGTANARTSKTEQVLDAYGNVTQTKLYDYASLTNPVRTYTNTYLTGSNYTSRYIRNRLLTSTVTDGTNTTTLVSNTYDGSGPTDVTGVRGHDPTYNYLFAVRGNLTTSVRLGVTRSIGHDVTGAAIAASDAYGHSVSIAFSSATNYAAPDALTPNSNSNLSTSYTYNSFLGLTSATGPNQANSTIQYDTYGRPTRSTSPHGAVTTYTYAYNPSTVTATTGARVVKTTLDGLGRTVKVETGDNSGVQSLVETEYDSCACSPLGKVKRVSLPYAPLATVYWTTYAYDALGRTLTLTAPDGSITSYLYQGNCTTITDPKGKWKKYTTDALGNLIQVSEPGGQETYYTYNLLNQLSLVSMPRGGITQTRTFNYNLTTGRLTSATNPETGTVTYTYNGDGSLASKTDAKNQQTPYTYDSYGRLTQAADYTYSYDTNPYDPSYSTNAWGRLTAVAWSTTGMGGLKFKEMYRYSAGGLLLGKWLRLQNALQIPGLGATFSYDSEGRYLGPQKYPGMPNGSWVTYSTDTLGRMVGIATQLNQGDTPRQVVKDVLYGSAGELQQMRVYQDPAPGSVSAYVKQTFSYNNLFQMTQQTAIDEESSGSTTTLLNLEYRYTAGQNNGRITQMKDWVSGEEVSYSYDSLNRLIQAATTGPEYGLNFAYDGFGNLTSQQLFKGTGYNTNLSYDGLTNRITTPGYSYDANGNLTAMPSLTMQYDVQNRMTQSVQNTSGTKLYAYAPNGQRVAQSDPPHTNYWDNTWSIYFYGPDGSRIADCWAGYDQSRAFTATCGTTYVYFGGKLVRKENKPQLQNGLWVYPPGVTLASDRLGSVRYAGGTTTSYYPYGEERTPTTNDTQKFATYTRDSATGLDYAKHRYYSSQIARFTSPDPYGGSAAGTNPQTWNRYAYVTSDPINGNDPSGLCPVTYSGSLTGPQGLCNDINYTAWSQGWDSWTVPPAGGFSQTPTIYDSNPAAWYQAVYAAWMDELFKLLHDLSPTLGDRNTLIGASVVADDSHHVIYVVEVTSVVNTPDPGQPRPAGTYYGWSPWSGLVMIVIQAPGYQDPAVQRPTSARWGGPLPFAPDPNFRKCGPGFYPSNDGSTCYPIPTGPPAPPPPSVIAPPPGLPRPAPVTGRQF